MRALAAAALGLSLSACGAGAPPYAECVDALDCPEPSDACYELRFTRSDGTDAEGRMCSLGCAVDADCPGDGACVALADDAAMTFFCAERCAVSSDCYAGFACTEVDGAARTMRLCLP